METIRVERTVIVDSTSEMDLRVLHYTNAVHWLLLLVKMTGVHNYYSHSSAVKMVGIYLSTHKIILLILHIILLL